MLCPCHMQSFKVTLLKLKHNALDVVQTQPNSNMLQLIERREWIQNQAWIGI
jgi:hypothetical protein